MISANTRPSSETEQLLDRLDNRCESGNTFQILAGSVDPVVHRGHLGYFMREVQAGKLETRAGSPC